MPLKDARGGIGLDSEQKVYHFLRSQIATQALLPGAQIVEGQVVEQTGLSRTPVRAALRRLAYEGMVVLRPNRGTFVAKPTPKEVRDTYEALLVLETQAIELACEIISDEDIARLRQLEKMEEDGTFDVLPKKEVLGLRHEMEKLNKNLGGIKDMKKLPAAMFVVDPRKEHIAVLEARKLHIPIVATVDTNCDPDEIDYVIPANDDAIRAVRLLAGKMADAVLEGRQGQQTAETEAAPEAKDAE